MPRGFSAHFGLDKVSPAAYRGWDGRLASCEADAEAMARIAKHYGFSSSPIWKSSEATLRAFNDCVDHLSKEAQRGDLIFLTFSGHGGRVEDLDGDEEDGFDESWCFFDGTILDDRLYKLWAKFKPGVRILVISDSCHSGTILRDKIFKEGETLFSDKQMTKKEVKNKKEAVKANVLLLASSQDDEYSRAGRTYSLFTAELLNVWNEGSFSGNYKQFLEATRKRVPFGQKPNYYVVSPYNKAFETQPIFTI